MFQCCVWHVRPTRVIEASNERVAGLFCHDRLRLPVKSPSRFADRRVKRGASSAGADGFKILGVPSGWFGAKLWA